MLENIKGFQFKRVIKQTNTERMELKGFVFNVVKKQKYNITQSSDSHTETNSEKEILQESTTENNKDIKVKKNIALNLKENVKDNLKSNDKGNSQVNKTDVLQESMEINSNENKIDNLKEHLYKNKQENKQKDIRQTFLSKNQEDIQNFGNISNAVYNTQSIQNCKSQHEPETHSLIKHIQVENKENYNSEQNTNVHDHQGSIMSPKAKFDKNLIDKAVKKTILNPRSSIRFEMKTINPRKSVINKSRPSFIDIINRPSRLPKPSIKLDPNTTLETKVNDLLSQLVLQNGFNIILLPIKLTNPYEDLTNDYNKAIEDARNEVDSIEMEIVKWNAIYAKVKEENTLFVHELGEKDVVKCDYTPDCKYDNIIERMKYKLGLVNDEVRERTEKLREKVVKKFGNSRALDPLLLLKKMSEM